MYATIQRWGDSNGLRIPTPLLAARGRREHDRVALTQTVDTITIRKAVAMPHRTRAERLTAFYGKPIEDIGPIQSEEVDWGKAEGSEVW